MQKLNYNQARWALYLSRFDFALKHVSGTKMGKTDGISRRLNWKVRVGKDNENKKVIKEKWICSLADVVVKEPEVDIIEKMKIAKEKNKEEEKGVEEMKKVRVKE